MKLNILSDDTDLCPSSRSRTAQRSTTSKPHRPLFTRGGFWLVVFFVLDVSSLYNDYFSRGGCWYGNRGTIQRVGVAQGFALLPTARKESSIVRYRKSSSLLLKPTSTTSIIPLSQNTFRNSIHVQRHSLLESSYSSITRMPTTLYMTLNTDDSPSGIAKKTFLEDDGTANTSTSSLATSTGEESTPFEPLRVVGTPGRAKLSMLTLLWVIAVLSALDRVAMSVAIIPMSTEFGYTDTFKGSISSFFSIGYGLMILPAGLIVANASPRTIMACGITVWSLATIATPWSTGMESLLPILLVRAMVGAAESVVLPTMQRLLSTWTNPEEKSVALATMFSGFQTGTVLAYLLSPAVVDLTGGWRGLFYTYGGVGLIALIPWLLFAQDAPSSKQSGLPTDQMGSLPLPSLASTDAKSTASLTEKTITERFQESTQVFRDAPFRGFFESPGVWAMLLAHCSKNWSLYNSLAWTPTFYSEQYEIGVRDSAFLSILPSIAAIIGGLLAGNVADAIIRKMEPSEERLSLIRKVFQSIGLYGPALALGVLALHIPEDPTVAQAFLTVSVGLSSFNAAGFEAGNQEKAGPKWAGLLYSVTSLPAVLVGTFGVYFTGQVLDWTQQDWTFVFGLNAFINVLGATAFLVLYDSKKEFD
jgi:ACS family sodium-dependent inorganic phosphate cotransporter